MEDFLNYLYFRGKVCEVIQSNQVGGRVIPVQTFFLDIYRQLGRIYGKLILDNFTVLV